MPPAFRLCPPQRSSATALRKSSSPNTLQHHANIFQSQPKPQPKSAAVTKTTGAAAGGAASGGRGGRARRGRGGRNSRPAKKTAEELDSEMADYFDNGGAAAPDATAAPAAAVAPAANGDAMEDEVLVSYSVSHCRRCNANSL
jgi:hypothetical protein